MRSLWLVIASTGWSGAAPFASSAARTRPPGDEGRWLQHWQGRAHRRAQAQLGEPPDTPPSPPPHSPPSPPPHPCASWCADMAQTWDKKVCFVLWLEPERENTDPSLATLMLAGAPTPRMHSAAGSTAGAVPSRVAAMGRVPSSSQCRRFLLNGRRRRQPPPAPPPLPPPRRLVSAAVTLAPTL